MCHLGGAVSWPVCAKCHCAGMDVKLVVEVDITDDSCVSSFVFRLMFRWLLWCMVERVGDLFFVVLVFLVDCVGGVGDGGLAYD